MDEQNRVYVVIRVPKSGSHSLSRMMRTALPNARFHSLPNPSKPDAGVSLIEKMRVVRARARRRWRNYGVLTDDKAWAEIAKDVRSGDVIVGHIGIADVHLSGFELDPITLIRDPVQRLFSEYFYSKRGYGKRSLFRKIYNRGRLRAAGTLDFSDYLMFLHERGDLYANRATRFITGSPTCADPGGYLMENYFHFGTLEHIDTFAETLSEKLRSPVPMQQLNRSENREEIVLSRQDKSRLDDLCGEDIRLHGAATALVEAGKSGRV